MAALSNPKNYNETRPVRRGIIETFTFTIGDAVDGQGDDTGQGDDVTCSRGFWGTSPADRRKAAAAWAEENGWRLTA